MTIDKKDMLNSILKSLSRIDYVKPEDIPNIELYMDQVTTFMEAHFSSTKRYEEDKILTKTMINNYAKNNLLPPPVKKKYSKEHILLLIFIYYFKNILSIKDIETLLAPMTDKYFHSDNQLSLISIYDEICKTEKQRIDSLQKEVSKIYKSAQATFPDSDSEDSEYLNQFSFICSLAFDVYIKKQLIEKLIDEMSDSTLNKTKK